MSSIDKATVKHVALLSRLALDESETAAYSSQLEAILRYISKLNELDTKDTPPTSHALSTLKNVFRKDAVKPSLGVEDVLRNAPAKDGDFFKVPQVIEGK
jgi:aspartyl/glutamyl-tRNA(Asn/Gln) amidotransferase C subunit